MDLDRIRSIESHTPFFVFDQEKVVENFSNYKKSLPDNTEICYAMKANSEEEVLETLRDVDSSFEVASKYELNLLKQINVSPKKIIYGTSVKPDDHIKEFVDYGVDRFAFDSKGELEKLARLAPGSRVYVRTNVNDMADSVFRMSEKFGTTPDNAISLLIEAKRLGLIPHGISFNVGSQAKNELAWARGVSDVNTMIERLSKQNIEISVINIGGGFPYDYEKKGGFPNIDRIGGHIRDVSNRKLSYIAEPGRGIVADAYCLVVSVISKNTRTNGHWLYVDAGVYSGLLEATKGQGSTTYEIEVLENREFSDEKEVFVLTGPTGDNIDVINRSIRLPKDIDTGDRIIIKDVGAYTFTLATRFNGFPIPETIKLS
jgi:ornithine decarboxylase